MGNERSYWVPLRYPLIQWHGPRNAWPPGPFDWSDMSDNKAEDAKGRIKEAAGSLTDDKSLKNEGKADQASASIKDKVEGAVDSVKDKLTGHDKDRFSGGEALFGESPALCRFNLAILGWCVGHEAVEQLV